MSYTPFKMKGPSLLKMVKKAGKKAIKMTDQMPGRSEIELKVGGAEKATKLAEKRYRDYKAKEKAKKDSSLKMSDKAKKADAGQKKLAGQDAGLEAKYRITPGYKKAYEVYDEYQNLYRNKKKTGKSIDLPLAGKTKK